MTKAELKQRLAGVYLHGRAGHPLPKYCHEGSPAAEAWQRGHDERRAFTATVSFTVGPDSDEHIRSKRAIRAELRSWLESLNAMVVKVEVV